MPVIRWRISWIWCERENKERNRSKNIDKNAEIMLQLSDVRICQERTVVWQQ